MRLEAIHLKGELELRVREVDPTDEHAPCRHSILGKCPRNAVGAQQRSHPRLEDARRPRGIGSLVEQATNGAGAPAPFARHRVESGSHAGHRRQATAKSAIERPRHNPKPRDRAEVDERPLDVGARNAVDHRDPSATQVRDAMNDNAGRHGRLPSGDGDLDEASVVVKQSQQSSG